MHYFNVSPGNELEYKAVTFFGAFFKNVHFQGRELE